MKEKLSYFERFFERRGVTHLLCDFDDTFIQTHKVISGGCREVVAGIAIDLGREVGEIKYHFDTAVNLGFRTLGVNPDTLWPHVMLKLSKVYQSAFDQKMHERYLEQLREIYQVVPEYHPGGREFLEVISQLGLPMALVTHASQHWTNFKLDSLGIRRFFEHIEIADVNSHKSASDWERAMNTFRVHPANVMVIGDSLRGDICAGREAGVDNLVWLNRIGWSVNSEGEVPERTIIVPEFTDLMDLMKQE